MVMSNDLTYRYQKEEINKNGSYYMKKGFGKHEKPVISPYEYGCLKSRRRNKGGVI